MTGLPFRHSGPWDNDALLPDDWFQMFRRSVLSSSSVWISPGRITVSCLTAWPLMMAPQCACWTSGTSQSVTLCQIPYDLNVWQHCYENVRPARGLLYFFLSFWMWFWILFIILVHDKQNQCVTTVNIKDHETLNHDILCALNMVLSLPAGTRLK